METAHLIGKVSTVFDAVKSGEADSHKALAASLAACLVLAQNLAELERRLSRLEAHPRNPFDGMFR